MKQYAYLFGPVPSRRFGRSLGVDLVPSKTCTYDCTFCQLGLTSVKSLARREYVPADAVIAELGDWLRSGGTADYITLSGSGEPTLHLKFGNVIDFVHAASSIPVLLLTNASLLWLPEVRTGAAKADVVKVSLSAWDQPSFEKINRPCAGLQFNDMVRGITDFRREFGGCLLLEVFLLRGVNTAHNDVKKIAALAGSIRPDRIQLNTAVRPPADKTAIAVPAAEMNMIAEMFNPRAEVVGVFGGTGVSGGDFDENAVLALLKRHPASISQMSASSGKAEEKVAAVISRLRKQGVVRGEKSGGETYFVACDGNRE